MTIFTYFEPFERGHCETWAKGILLAAAQDPRITQLRLVTSQGLAQRLSNLVSETGIDCTPLAHDHIASLQQPNLMRRGLAQWRTARTLLKETGGKLFLPFMDHAILGAFCDRTRVAGQVSGVIFRPTNFYNYPLKISHINRYLLRWSLYALARRPALGPLFILDEYVHRLPQRRMFLPLTFLPDPIACETQLSGRTTGCPDKGKRRVFLLLGALRRSKGIFETLQAIPHLPPARRADTCLRIVGAIHANDRAGFYQLLSQTRSTCPESNIEVIDEFLPDTVFNQEIANCDVVLLPYQNAVGSSSIIYLAAAHSKPIIAQHTGLLGYMTSTYNLGRTVDATNPQALAAAMQMDIPLPSPQVLAAFLHRHVMKIFTGTMLDTILE